MVHFSTETVDTFGEHQKFALKKIIADTGRKPTLPPPLFIPSPLTSVGFCAAPVPGGQRGFFYLTFLLSPERSSREGREICGGQRSRNMDHPQEVAVNPSTVLSRRRR